MAGKFKSRQFAKRVNSHFNPNFRFNYYPEDKLIDLIENTPKPLFLFLDGIQDPHNLGACLRTSLGVGVTAVIIPKNGCVGVNETVNRVSCGAAEKLKIISVSNFVRLIDKLKKHGVWFVGMSAAADKNVYEIDLNIPLALVLGSEGTGLRKLTEKNMDFLAKLPMNPELESLNVSVTAGVCLYEIFRQRTK